MNKCAGLFKPKSNDCAICGADKSAHQVKDGGRKRPLVPKPMPIIPDDDSWAWSYRLPGYYGGKYW